jgi:hypothetical protein
MIVRSVVGYFLRFNTRRDLGALNSKMGDHDGLEPH